MNRCYNCFINGMRKTIALLLLVLLPTLLFAGFFGVQAGFDFSYLDLTVKKNGSTKFHQEEAWLLEWKPWSTTLWLQHILTFSLPHCIVIYCRGNFFFLILLRY